MHEYGLLHNGSAFLVWYTMGQTNIFYLLATNMITIVTGTKALHDGCYIPRPYLLSSMITLMTGICSCCRLRVVLSGNGNGKSKMDGGSRLYARVMKYLG